MPPSHPITIDLGSTFGSTDDDVDRVRHGQISWLGELPMPSSPIFSMKIPLEVVGAIVHGPVDDSHSSRSPPSSLTLRPCGDVDIQGTTPDSAVQQALLGGGRIDMAVDSLSRSIILTEIEARTFVEELQSRVDIDSEGITALKRALLVPQFYDEFSEETATQAKWLLKENVRQHELEHIGCLINPRTALWREFELYWRSILVTAKPHTWCDSEFLRRLAILYSTPSHFTIELLAMLREDYTASNSTVQEVVESNVAAQRGVEGEFVRFIKRFGLDPGALRETLQQPVGEQYCDLWLAYVLDEIRSGRSLTEIEPAGFYRTVNEVTPCDEVVRNSATRAEFVDFICDICLGPVFEFARLKFVDETFVLERAWFTSNRSVSDDESLLAVRRALFRRQFLSTFGTESGLNDVLEGRERAVERVIRGAALEEVSLFDGAVPSTEHLSKSLETAQKAAADALLGSQATVDDLHSWLNIPGFSIEEGDFP